MALEKCRLKAPKRRAMYLVLPSMLVHILLQKMRDGVVKVFLVQIYRLLSLYFGGMGVAFSPALSQRPTTVFEVLILIDFADPQQAGPDPPPLSSPAGAAVLSQGRLATERRSRPGPQHM